MNKGDSKYLNDRADKLWQFFYTTYNHWVNMYAIFNGALFVGLYTCSKLKYVYLINFLGVIAGWCWFCSLNGFYSWIISYVYIANFYDKKLQISQGKYKIHGIYENNKVVSPFSTQKLTQFLAKMIALVWSAIFIYNTFEVVKKCDKKFGIFTNCENIQLIYLLTAIIIVFLVFGFVLIVANYKCRENLSEFKKLNDTFE